MDSRWASQRGFRVRFDWGPVGLEAVGGEVVVIVDVLRFTTAVDAAVSRGARVYPYRWREASARDFADGVGAELADDRYGGRLSLSPQSLMGLEPGATIVLPSPNGSTCAAIASDGGAMVIAACLRNAAAIAAWLNARSDTVAVIASGERWHDGSLRPALEDYLGAGAVIAGLDGQLSPEARAAAAAWTDAQPEIDALLRSCASGLELAERGWHDDLDYAAAVNVSRAVPVLRDGTFGT